MARLLVYDAYENKVYTYANLRENDPMPYSTGTTPVSYTHLTLPTKLPV